MQDKRSVVMKSRLSAIICLQDSYTARPPVSTSDVEVKLGGIYRKPVRKANGYYIFTDLENGVYRLAVTSKDYIEEMRSVVVSPDQAVIHVSLLPKPSYPFVGGATLIRAMLRDHRGQPVGGAQVTAYVQSPECAKASLAADAAPGATEVSLVQIAGKINIGDCFLIRGDDAGRHERCTIAALKDLRRAFALEQGLQHGQPRGAALMPVVRSAGSAEGEIAVPFASYRQKAFSVRLEIAAGDRAASHEVQVSEGNMTNLGVLTI